MRAHPIEASRLAFYCVESERSERETEGGPLTGHRAGATLASFSPLTGSLTTEASYGEASSSGEHRGGLSRAAGRARHRVSLRQRGHGLRAPHRGVCEARRAGADEPAAADHPARDPG